MTTATRHPMTLKALAVLGAHLKATWPRLFTSTWDGSDWTTPLFRTTQCVSTGVIGGEHRFTCPGGLSWSVDLVLGTVREA